jgi:hypothetical protein
MKIVAIIVLTLSAITAALSYERKFIHPECTEENGVRHCEVPSEEATPTTPTKPHEQLSPQAPQINSDVPDHPQRYTNAGRRFPISLSKSSWNDPARANSASFETRLANVNFD